MKRPTKKDLTKAKKTWKAYTVQFEYDEKKALAAKEEQDKKQALQDQNHLENVLFFLEGIRKGGVTYDSVYPLGKKHIESLSRILYNLRNPTK